MVPVEYIAHVRKEEGGEWETHDLARHLLETAERAGKFGNKFGAGKVAYLSGLWHDLGKFHPDFQERIRIKSGYFLGEDAHLEGKTPKHVEHSTPGGIHCEEFGEKISVEPVSFPILCHHTGLKNSTHVEGRIAEEGNVKFYRELLEHVPEEILKPNGIDLTEKTLQKPPGFEKSLFIRMVFSALTDADWLGTEKFMNPERSRFRETPGPNLSELQSRLDAFLIRLAKNAKPSPVNRIRGRILEEVRKKANREPGFFSLNVPTGGGKLGRAPPDLGGTRDRVKGTRSSSLYRK